MTRHREVVSAAVPPLLWTAAALGAARLPWACEAVPVLGVLRGPLGLVLALAGATVAIGAGLGVLAGGRLHALAARLMAANGAVLFAVSAGLLAAIGLSYTARLRVSGDEPHYLIMAQSLWREGDLDLVDNYAREDYREYTPGPVAPHYGSARKDGRPFPAHSPGLPAALAPLYAVGGRPACVLFLALAAAALAREAAKAAGRLQLEREYSSGGEADGAASREAEVLAWIVALGPPVTFYSFHLYTEVPSALCLAVGLRLILEGPPWGRASARAAAAGLAASALPWLHVKMVPAAMALGLLGTVRLRGRPRVAFLGVAAAMALVYLGYYWSIFGVASPLAIYGGVPRGEGGSPLRAFAGLLLDRSFGLLPHAPVFVVGLAGLAAVARRRAFGDLLVGAAVVAPVLGWRMWWGGQCPPARFLVPVVPLLAAAAALRAREGRGLARWRWPLVLAGLALLAIVTIDPGRLLLINRADRPTRLWSAASGDVPVARYLPSLVSRDAAETRVAVVWAAALGLTFALDLLARKRDGVDRAFRSLGLPLILLLAIGAGVDTWARRGDPIPRVEPSVSPIEDEAAARGVAVPREPRATQWRAARGVSGGVANAHRDGA